MSKSTGAFRCADNVAPYMFPAKFSFEINAAPSCANDYAVFGLNVAGATPGQANLVGVNKRRGWTVRRGSTVTWAYNGSTAGGSVLTSPVVSLDGERIAYVESAAGTAVFHVLAGSAGEGTLATVAATPTLNGACAGTVANPTSSCLKSVTFSTTATDTLSSPWVDYATDKAFVGGDDGRIYRISCAFDFALNTDPTVDWTFTLPAAGAGGAAVAAQWPSLRFPQWPPFVADQLGQLWVINAGGASASLNAGPVMIGGDSCTIAHPPGRTGTGADCTANGGSFGIPDSITMDSSTASQRIFAFSGNDGTAGASAVVAHLRMNLSSLARVHVGLGSVGVSIATWNIHTGAFDNVYFRATPSTGHLFRVGTGAANTQPTHYWIGFAAYPAMDAAPAGSLLRTAVANLPCAPYTELFNPNITLTVDMSSLTTSARAPSSPAGDQCVPGRGQRIVIDNVSTSGAASSVYFSTQGVVTVGSCAASRCADPTGTAVGTPIADPAERRLCRTRLPPQMPLEVS